MAEGSPPRARARAAAAGPLVRRRSLSPPRRFAEPRVRFSKYFFTINSNRTQLDRRSPIDEDAVSRLLKRTVIRALETRYNELSRVHPAGQVGATYPGGYQTLPHPRDDSASHRVLAVDIEGPVLETGGQQRRVHVHGTYELTHTTSLRCFPGDWQRVINSMLDHEAAAMGLPANLIPKGVYVQLVWLRSSKPVVNYINKTGGAKGRKAAESLRKLALDNDNTLAATSATSKAVKRQVAAHSLELRAAPVGEVASLAAESVMGTVEGSGNETESDSDNSEWG